MERWPAREGIGTVAVLVPCRSTPVAVRLHVAGELVLESLPDFSVDREEIVVDLGSPAG